MCHERFGSDDGVVMGQCHVEVSNFGAFDCFFRVLKGYASTASVIIGSQRLAGKAQPPNSMLHMSYHEMVFALKFVSLLGASNICLCLLKCSSNSGLRLLYVLSPMMKHSFEALL